MKTVAATEAKNRLGAILDAAQREPIVIRRQDRDIAVILSMADYDPPAFRQRRRVPGSAQ